MKPNNKKAVGQVSMVMQQADILQVILSGCVINPRWYPSLCRVNKQFHIILSSLQAETTTLLVTPKFEEIIQHQPVQHQHQQHQQHQHQQQRQQHGTSFIYFLRLKYPKVTSLVIFGCVSQRFLWKLINEYGQIRSVLSVQGSLQDLEGVFPKDKAMERLSLWWTKSNMKVQWLGGLEDKCKSFTAGFVPFSRGGECGYRTHSRDEAIKDLELSWKVSVSVKYDRTTFLSHMKPELLSYGIEFYSYAEEWRAVLESALLCKDTRNDKVVSIILSEVIAHSSFFRTFNKEGETPYWLSFITLACRNKHYKTVQSLLVIFPLSVRQVELRTHKGNTLLHYLAPVITVELLDILIKAGETVDARNEQGQTPLFKARTKEGVLALLSMMSSPFVLDLSKQTCIECYIAAGAAEAVRALLTSVGPSYWLNSEVYLNSDRRALLFRSACSVRLYYFLKSHLAKTILSS